MTDPTTHEFCYESAGARLFAVERGRGEPVVFLHGGLADHRAALFRAGSLAAAHRLIAPDVRGAGRSIYSGELSWELLADDLAALLDHLDLERAVIGGVSAGSGIALSFARRHPRRLRALLLVSPVYAGAELGLDDAQRRAMDRMGAVGRQAASEGIAALFPLFVALPPAIRDIALTMAAGFDPASVAATTRFLASGVHPFTRLAELAALAVPTLVVPGTDPEHPAAVADLYARTLPGAALVDPTADLGAQLEALLRRPATAV
jgi:pimeloyl-ACP methyl ester carboxylesterase